jgi:hypothetical protein
MIDSNKTQTAFYVILAFYVTAAFAILCISAQGLSWDAGTTLKMTDNGYKNIPFNNYAHPNPLNLQHDENEFVTWWSPGQFVLPMIIQQLFSVKLNIAIKILVGICMLISGLGIYKLFKKLIDDNADASVATLVIFLFTLLQPFFFGNLFEYDGGGILMITYCPWFIYWVLKLDKISINSLILLLVGSFLGFFLKAAFTSIFAGALLYLFLAHSVMPYSSFKNIDIKKALKTGLLLGLIFVIYIITTKLLFLNYNRNIADSSIGIRLQARVIIYPIIAPFLGFFSSHSVSKTAHWLAGCALVIPIYYFILKSSTLNLRYKYVLVSFFGVGTAFYTLLYFLSLDVSYEYRHFILLSILITPAVVLVFWRGHIRFIIAGVLLFYTAVNISTYITAIKAKLEPSGSVGYYSGIRLSYPSDLVSKIHQLDSLNAKGDDIYYFKNYEPIAALEIRNNRVLFEDDYINFHFDNAGRFKPVAYYGHNRGQIYVVYPLNNFEQDSLHFLTKFEKYKNFEKIYQTTGYAIFKALPILK